MMPPRARALGIRMGLLMLIVALGAMALSPRPVQANGVPQLVKLTYLEGISTWARRPRRGAGVLLLGGVLAPGRRWGLPRLVGQAYEGWLVRSSSNEAISVGQFNAASDESVVYEAQLPPIRNYSLDFFVLTIESLSNGDADPVSIGRSGASSTC